MVPVRPPPHPPVPATPNQQLVDEDIILFVHDLDLDTIVPLQHARSRSLAPTGDAENAVIHVQTARLDVRPLARLRFLVKYKGEFYLQSHVDCLGIRSEATLFGKGQMDSVGPVGGVRMPAHGSITTFDVHSQEVALLFTGRSRRIPTRERSVRLCQRFSEQVGYTGEFKPPASCKLRKMGTLRIFRLEFHPVLPPLYPAQMISQRSAQATEGISALKRKRGGTEDDSEGGTGMAGGGKASKKAKQIHDSPHPRRRQSTRIATAAKKKGGSASSVVVRRERRSLTIAELHAPSLVCVVALDASRKHVVVAALQKSLDRAGSACLANVRKLYHILLSAAPVHCPPSASVVQATSHTGTYLNSSLRRLKSLCATATAATLLAMINEIQQRLTERLAILFRAIVGVPISQAKTRRNAGLISVEPDWLTSETHLAMLHLSFSRILESPAA